MYLLHKTKVSPGLRSSLVKSQSAVNEPFILPLFILSYPYLPNPLPSLVPIGWLPDWDPPFLSVSVLRHPVKSSPINRYYTAKCNSASLLLLLVCPCGFNMGECTVSVSYIPLIFMHDFRACCFGGNVSLFCLWFYYYFYFFVPCFVFTVSLSSLLLHYGFLFVCLVWGYFFFAFANVISSVKSQISACVLFDGVGKNNCFLKRVSSLGV